MLKTLSLLVGLSFVGPVMATQISVGFSPSGQALQNVLQAIHSARTRIDLAAYSFTSDEVADALVRAEKRGVKVRVVADYKDNARGKYSKVGAMQKNAIPIRLDPHYAIMHNKFLIVDGVTTETGSFNYTSSADKRNAENALVIWNQPAVASIYEHEFERLWAESSPAGQTPGKTHTTPRYPGPSFAY
ncbi:phospholipase D family nuclease [Klebsiella aerogenes]